MRLEPAIFNNMINLRQLKLRNNIIDQLHRNAFQGLKNLAHLDMSENRLEKLPAEAFSNLVYLTDIYLNGNQISELNSTTFSSNRTLTYINLSQNRIKSIHRDLFASLPFLRVLNLSNNMIELVYRHTFTKQRQLRVLDLSHNRIKDIEEESISELDWLEILYLNNNRLSKLNLRGNLMNMSRILQIYLNNNSCIDNIYAELFRDMPCLKYLYLDVNIDYFRSLCNQLFKLLRNLEYVVLESEERRLNLIMRRTILEYK